MRWVARIRMAIRDVLHRKAFEREMEEELALFEELDADARRSDGLGAAEARRAARAGLGGVESTKAHLRELRAGASLESMAQDFRYGLRLLRRQPGFTVAAILTIALGIGPLIVVLGLANWLFMRPSPGITNSSDLVQVEFVTRSPRGGIGRASLSYANYADLMSAIRVFSGLAGQAETAVSVAARGTDARRAGGGYVMHDYFRVLGVPIQGRSFTADEDREPGGAPVTVLGYAMAVSLYGDVASAIGQPIAINGLPFTVIGVAPREFMGPQPGSHAELWLTGATFMRLGHAPPERWQRGRTNGVFNVFVGRIAPGVTFEQAKADLTRATRALAYAYPSENEKFKTADIWMERRPGLPIRLRPQAATLVTMLGSIGALLMIVAAANVANLLLFRGVRRRDEIAVRQALGATRWRIVRAHLLDSAVLALLGGAGGIVLAYWSARLLDGMILPGMGLLALPIDWRVILLAGAVSLTMAAVFGMLPALLASSGGAAGVLRRGSVPIITRGRYLRNALTALQLATSLTLLIGALLLTSTMRNLRDVDTGVDTSRVAGMFVDVSSHGYNATRARTYYEAFLDRARALAGIDALSLSSHAPFFGSIFITRITRGEGNAEAPIHAGTNHVTPGYFGALGIQILRGRNFTDAEALTLADSTCGPVIVSALLARTLFGEAEAVGRAFTIPRTAMNPTMECTVVGVAADVRWNGPAGDSEPFLYRPLMREGVERTRVILARTDRSAAQLGSALRKVAASIDPAVPLYLERAVAETLDRRLAERRLLSIVLTTLGVLGFVLAAVGLYGLVSETVAERTREFGVRLALGADPRRILVHVLRGATGLALAGLALGIPIAFALARGLRSQLFGVTAIEPSIYALAAALLGAVVLAASAIPARAATRVDPVAALRAE
jgi:putative ABC transport system permease protein